MIQSSPTGVNFIFVAVKFVDSNITVITASKRSLGQGSIFTGVCQSTCPQEGVSVIWLPVWLPDPMFLLGRGVCPWSYVPSRGYPKHRHPWTETLPSPHGEERAVHILLECFLVGNFVLNAKDSIEGRHLKPKISKVLGWGGGGGGEGISFKLARNLPCTFRCFASQIRVETNK